MLIQGLLICHKKVYVHDSTMRDQLVFAHFFNPWIDQHPMLKPHETKDEYWTPKPIPKPYFMDR